jgi:hypothetical protein
MDIGLSVKIQNATNISYQTIENRSMPGLSYLAGLRIGFNSSHIKQIKNKAQ